MPMSHEHHILVIDDDDSVLALFSDVLSEEGYRVSTQAYVPSDRTDIIASAPDCIILDYMLAEDGSGWSLLQVLRTDARTAEIPVILCTGAVKKAQELSAHLEGMKVQVLLKPFDVDALLTMVATVISGSEPSSTGG